VGAGPDAALVVAVTPLGREVAVVGLLRAVVALLLETAAVVVVAGWLGAAVVVVVSAPRAVVLVVLLGAPAMANWPPRRNEGGPLWVSL
jgi:hypothetical protein